MIIFCCPHCEAPIESDELVPGYGKLTFTQQQIIDLLAMQPGKRYSLQQIIEYVWLGRDARNITNGLVRTQIAHLNARLAKKMVYNQHGVGYYLMKGK